MKKRWIVLATIGWPILHVVVFLFRFRELPPLFDLLYFIPTGLLGTMAVHVLLLRSRSPGQTAATVLGAFLLAPLALAGNLLGGLFGVLGVTVYGLVPLTAGAVFGWLFGKRFQPTRD